MGKKVSEFLQGQPVMVESSATVAKAAQLMRDANIGAVIVQDDGKVLGIVTDRDIVVRAVANDKDPKAAPVSEICSRDLTTLSPDEDEDRAVELMRKKALRRIVVADGDKPLGIVSLGDLATRRDPGSALGEISMAPPNG